MTACHRTILAAVFLGAAIAGCNTARRFGPEPPPLRAASASDFAVEVEFPRPISVASALEPGRFVVLENGDAAAPVAIYSASLADTVYGRVVLLLLSGGPLADSTRYVVRSTGVVDVYGKPLADAEAQFRAGLRYSTDLASVFATHCNGCHGQTRAEGAYRTDTLAALFGAGVDSIPDLIGGDPNCALVHRTRPLRSMYRAGGLSPLDADMIANWVVSYQARP